MVSLLPEKLSSLRGLYLVTLLLWELQIWSGSKDVLLLRVVSGWLLRYVGAESFSLWKSWGSRLFNAYDAQVCGILARNFRHLRPNETWEIVIIKVVGMARVTFVGFVDESTLRFNQLDLFNVLIWIRSSIILENPMVSLIGGKSWVQLDLLVRAKRMRNIAKITRALLRWHIEASRTLKFRVLS